MAGGAKQAASVYHARRPQESPFYQLVEGFCWEFEAVHEECSQESPWPGGSGGGLGLSAVSLVVLKPPGVPSHFLLDRRRDEA